MSLTKGRPVKKMILLNTSHLVQCNRSLLLLVLCTIVTLAWPSRTLGFTFEDVIAKAREEAGHQHKLPRKDQVPRFLLDMTYDQWRNIRFKPEHTFWRGENLPFQIQLFHPGLYYNRLVKINSISGSGVEPFQFSPELFNYRNADIRKKIPADFGFAGFRLLYSLHDNKIMDELAVFLGASYFRAIGAGQHFGLSARGLAIDTGEDSGEEFPYFKEFWLETPEPDSQKFTLYALLDSHSITGAYRFVIRPGKQLKIDVNVRLFPRKEIKKLGIAPLTSMFFYDEQTNFRPIDDFRPEIHDSDGLLLKVSEKERIWRPLVNREKLFINSFSFANPPGFGLVQRDINFNSYQDGEAHYHRRPSALITPGNDWGAGRVELIQIPTENETNDNIVAFWVPDQLPDNGVLAFNYSLNWYLAAENTLGVANVIATRSAPGPEENSRRLIIDFKGGDLSKLPDKLDADNPLKAIVNIQKDGEIVDKQLYKIPCDDCWRLVLTVKRKNQGAFAEALPEQILKLPPLELEAYLEQDDNILTEKWSYAVWP